MNALRPHIAEVAPLTAAAEPEARPYAGIIGQLRKRKVCRTAISYMLVMWLNLQIGDVIFPMIGLPDWALRLVIVIGVMGFPVVLILAWAFQITSHGIVLDAGDADAGSEPGTERQLDTIVNLLLLLSSVVLSVLLLAQFLGTEPDPDAGSSAGLPGHTVVTALTLEAMTDQPANRTLATGMRAELAHRLIMLDGIDLLPQGGELDPDDRRRRVSLAGTVLLEEHAALVLMQLIDLGSGKYLDSVRLQIAVDSVQAAEALTAERVVDSLRDAVLPDRAR